MFESISCICPKNRRDARAPPTQTQQFATEATDLRDPTLSHSVLGSQGSQHFEGWKSLLLMEEIRLTTWNVSWNPVHNGIYLPYQLVKRQISEPSTVSVLLHCGIMMLDFRTVIDGYGINFEIISCDCMQLNGISQWVMFSTGCPFPLIKKIAYDTWPTSTFLMYIVTWRDVSSSLIYLSRAFQSTIVHFKMQFLARLQIPNTTI